MTIWKAILESLPDQNWEVLFWLYKKDMVIIQVSHRDPVTMKVTRSTKSALSKSSGEETAVSVLVGCVSEVNRERAK